jgi:predicted nucleic acid-binding protein
MNHFLLDASGLAKRYSHETGADRIDHLFQQVPLTRLACLMLGAAEVVSVLVRRKNAGILPVIAFRQSMLNLRDEVIRGNAVMALATDNYLIETALPLIDRHAVNSTDAIVLQAALAFAHDLRAQGDDLVLVASDQRMLRAAGQEGLITFDPEVQDVAALQLLLAVP